MHILNLAQTDGLRPKRVPSTKGGEYHSLCPGCGGRDRFIIWDKLDRYFCRQCRKRGDSIQYLRDFHSLSYKEACMQLEISPKSTQSQTQLWKPTPSFIPRAPKAPPIEWRQQALHFVKSCHQHLIKTPVALDLLYKRGFTLGTIQLYCLGWNPESFWIKRTVWGLQDHSNKKLWFPKGLLIPTFDSAYCEPIKLKIRRDDWQKDDKHPKYVEITESMQSSSMYGACSTKPIIILESEFDAMLVQQCAADICCSVALGGASKRPDFACHNLLITAPLILFVLDVDQAGATAFRWWRKTYPSIILWPSPIGKSPGDALIQGIDIRRWAQDGIHSVLRT